MNIVLLTVASRPLKVDSLRFSIDLDTSVSTELTELTEPRSNSP